MLQICRVDRLSRTPEKYPSRREVVVAWLECVTQRARNCKYADTAGRSTRSPGGTDGRLQVSRKSSQTDVSGGINWFFRTPRTSAARLPRSWVADWIWLRPPARFLGAPIKYGPAMASAVGRPTAVRGSGGPQRKPEKSGHHADNRQGKQPGCRATDRPARLHHDEPGGVGTPTPPPETDGHPSVQQKQ